MTPSPDPLGSPMPRAKSRPTGGSVLCTATQVQSRSAAGVEHQLLRAGIQRRERVATVERHERIRRGIVGLGPAIVAGADARRFDSFARAAPSTSADAASPSNRSSRDRAAVAARPAASCTPRRGRRAGYPSLPIRTRRTTRRSRSTSPRRAAHRQAAQPRSRGAVSEVAGTPVRQVAVGSSVNSSYRERQDIRHDQKRKRPFMSAICQPRQESALPARHFTSTSMRIQGCMQHWKRCLPFDRPVMSRWLP